MACGAALVVVRAVLGVVVGMKSILRGRQMRTNFENKKCRLQHRLYEAVRAAGRGDVSEMPCKELCNTRAAWSYSCCCALSLSVDARYDRSHHFSVTIDMIANGSQKG